MSRSYDPALQGVLTPLVDDLRRALPDDLVGVYLYGSAVSGGFDPGVSDLDLVAVTRRNVEELDLAALENVHHRVVERDATWSNRLEIVYVAERSISGRIGGDSVAVISPGEPFHVTRPASDWLQNWYLVRETGITLLGRPATDIIRPISQADFLMAVRSYLEYLRGVDSLGYAVISACRAVCTLQTRRACSKQEGAAWIRERRPEWAWLIDAALASRLSHGRSGFIDANSRSAARQFVDQLVERSDLPVA